MYIDPDIKLREDLPQEILEKANELQRLYEQDDWLHFDNLFDGLEVMAKSYYIAGKISYSDLKTIFHKYGLMY